MKELAPNEVIMIQELVERDGLPNQSFSLVRVENAVNRIDKELAGWIEIVVKATIRIESLEKLRASVIKEWKLRETGR